MKQGKTRFVILGLLSETPLSGYEIKKIIEIRFSFFWSESYGQLYPELKAMVRQGLIAGDASQEAPAGRKKTVYSLTESGRSALLEWLAVPPEHESVRFELLLKMYFSSLADVGIMQSHLRLFEESHKAQLGMLNAFQAELLHIRGDHDNHEDILRIIDFGQRVYTAYLDWSHETMAYLEGRKTI